MSRSFTSLSHEVIVIGAGAAGLAAAGTLARSGRRVLVLEARGRIGGRVWSRNEPGLNVPVELGAEFIHGRPAATFNLMRQAGIAAVDAPIVRSAVRGGRLEPARREDLFEEIQRALRRHAPALAKRDVSMATFLARARHGLSAEAQVLARMRVQGYEAADPVRASASAIAEDWGGEGALGAGHYRPAGGYGALLASLAVALDDGGAELKLQSVVRALRWQRGAVEVAGTRRGKPFRVSAPRAIITLPLGVLQQPPGAAGAVRFTPALEQKRKPLGQLVAGAVIKAALRFRAPFWEEVHAARYRGCSFFHDPEGAFPTFWTAAPERDALLVAWAGGPKARRLTGRPERAIARAAVTGLEALFGKDAGIEGLLETAWVHDWQRDPYARGAYSYVAVGGRGARKSLAAPLAGTLYFAGEAADFEGEHGTVAGALQSGIRAAGEAAGG